ncbi:MAG: ABC transporter permease [Candidatus Methylomirabilales bacterium]
MSTHAQALVWRKPKGNLWRALVRFRSNPLSVLGLTIVLLVAFAAIFAPFIAPFPEDGRGDAVHFGETFQPPNLKHLLGSDEVGRDLLSRLLFGARLSLMLGVVVLSLAVLIGVPLGLIAGYFGGLAETLIMRVTDVFLALPPVVLALAITAAFERSLLNSMIAISIAWWPWYARLAYGEASSIKQEDFIQAAESQGASRFYIMLREILPNMTSPLIVKISLDMGYAILTGAILGFLGLGAQSPTPEWGTIVTSGREYLPNMWWISTFSGLAIFVTVLGFNLLGDGLRDFFDVESEGR